MYDDDCFEEMYLIITNNKKSFYFMSRMKRILIFDEDHEHRMLIASYRYIITSSHSVNQESSFHIKTSLCN